MYNSRFFSEDRQDVIDKIPGTMGYTLITFHAVGDDIALNQAKLRLDWRALDIFKQHLAQELATNPQFDRIGYVTRVEMLLGQAMLDYNGHFTLDTTTLTSAIQKQAQEPMQLTAIAADLILPIGLTDLRHVVHLTKWVHENHVVYHLVAGLPALEQKVDNLRNAEVFKNKGPVLIHETELDSQALLLFVQDLIQDYFGVEVAKLHLSQAAFGQADPADQSAGSRVLIADFEN